MGNRVVRFRGKRVDNGEWVYGFVAKIDVHECGKDYEETVILRQLKYDDGDYYVQEFIDVDAVIPETVGQYTGLKDRDGVEIYEGDIVACGEGKVPTEIRWVQASSAFMAYNIKLKEYYLLNKSFEIFIGEIIGNIHDRDEVKIYEEVI